MLINWPPRQHAQDHRHIGGHRGDAVGFGQISWPNQGGDQAVLRRAEERTLQAKQEHGRQTNHHASFQERKQSQQRHQDLKRFDAANHDAHPKAIGQTPRKAGKEDEGDGQTVRRPRLATGTKQPSPNPACGQRKGKGAFQDVVVQRG